MPDGPAGPSTFPDLIQHIEGLDGAEVGHELRGAMRLGETTLRKIWEQDPGEELSAAMADAIGRVDNPEVQAELGGRAADLFSGLLASAEPDALLPVAAESARFAQLIPTAREKASAFTGLAEKLAYASTKVPETNAGLRQRVVEQIDTYLDQAASALNVSNVGEMEIQVRISMLDHVANESTRAGAVLAEAGIPQPQLTSMFKQPGRLYGQAREAVNELQDPVARLPLQARIADSMAETAYEIYADGWSPEEAQALFETSMQIIDSLIETSSVASDEQASSLPDTIKTDCLSNVGYHLKNLLGNVYTHQQSAPEAERTALVRRTISVFEALQKYAEREVDEGESAKASEAAQDAWGEAVNAADKLLDPTSQPVESDLNAAERLLEIGYELAVSKTKAEGGFAIAEVVNRIGDMARRTTDTTTALTLHVLTHRLETERQEDDTDASSELIRQNAIACLKNMSSLEAGNAIETIDPSFAQYLVEIAGANRSGRTSPADKITELLNLHEFIKDLDLLLKIALKVEALEKERA
ncbi:MAG TPA: hypothetical protein VIJ68_01615, partial [Candidatus Saccharimonadales bacterium]